jgi:hypothetical protein
MGNNWTNRIAEEYGYEGGVNSDYAQEKLLSFIIGRNGVAGCDFNFTAPGNSAQQNLDLGAVIFAQCKITKIQVKCLETLAGGTLTDFKVSSDIVSGGVTLIPATTDKTLNVIVTSGVIPGTINWTLPNHIFFGGIPTGDFWSNMTAGKWQVTITYKDYSQV